MHKLGYMMRGLLATSALMMVVTPAQAGKKDRANAAIAEAQGKIDAATRMKAGEVTPDTVARAQASLRLAQEELKSGHKQNAIHAAIESQQMADIAIGRAQQRRDTEAEARAADLASAREQADAANGRAEAAEQAAAAAAADARAARDTPPVVVATPPQPPTTTITTETTRTAPVARTAATTGKPHVVPRARTASRQRAAATERTTTTVTTMR